MSLSSIFFDYRNAIKTARKAGLSTTAAAHSVLLARLKYNLGPQFHSIFELWNKPRESWSDYIGSHEVNERHRLLSPHEYRQLTNDKLSFSIHCAKHSLSTVPTLCTIDLKPVIHPAAPPNCIAIDQWLKFIESAPECLFIKRIDGIHGLGAFVAKRNGDVWSYSGISGSASDLHSHCLSTIQGRRGWLIQPEIRPHPDVSKRMSPKALATLRLVTIISAEGPKIIFGVLRIPAGDNSTDNWSLGLSGNLVAPIDRDSGTLGIARSSRSSAWPVMYSTAAHPDTGYAIDGYKLPYWEAAKQLALDGQKSLPQVPTLGWDIAITEAGPLIVETNWGYGVELIQVALQRGIRPDLQPTFIAPTETI